MSDKIILPITPQSYVSVPHEKKKFLRIPDRCLYIPSLGRGKRKDEIVDVMLLGCELWNNTGYCRHTASKSTRAKKKRIFQYWKYRKAIKEMCDAAGFDLKMCGWSLYFYYPVPTRWNKTKKAMLRGQCKVSKPDIDNLEKAFFDSLGKKRGDTSGKYKVPDEYVAQMSGHGKFWMYDTEAKEGYIEILLNQPVYNPFNVMFINQIV